MRSQEGRAALVSGVSSDEPKWLKIRPQARPQSRKDWADNDEALLELTSGKNRHLPENRWSLDHAFQGVQVFGGTGSGKSTGSGQAIARAFLDANLGGLVLTAKADEAGVWRQYAKDANRERDLIVVEEGAGYRFNFLRYELKRPGVGAGHTENLVNLFCSVLEASERRNGQSGSSDSYWQRTLKQLLRNAIDLAVLAIDDLDLPSLYRIVTSAPVSRADVTDEEWRKESACFALLEVAAGKAEQKGRRRTTN